MKFRIICIEDMKTLNPDSNYLFLRTSSIQKRMCSDDILYIYCEDTLCVIHFGDGSSFSCCKPLSYFEEQLSECSFARANRQYLISLSRVCEIKNVSSRKKEAVMQDGMNIPISYRRWPGIRRLLSMVE